jgi:hypothetical protein
MLAVSLGFLGFVYYLIWGYFQFTLGFLFPQISEFHGVVITLIRIALLAFLIIAHEGLHALPGVFFSKKGFKSVKLGFLSYKKLFSPFCHVKEVLRINHFRVICVLPMIILGIIPATISLIIGNVSLMIVATIMILAGLGDFSFIWKLRKEKGDDFVYDLPDEAGFIIFRKK